MFEGLSVFFFILNIERVFNGSHIAHLFKDSYPKTILFCNKNFREPNVTLMLGLKLDLRHIQTINFSASYLSVAAIKLFSRTARNETHVKFTHWADNKAAACKCAE